ncbi:MAG: universal stress protein [bacterium]
MRINKILCPVDSSESSEQALKYATFLAWSHGSKLCLLHVIEHSHAFDEYMTSYAPPEIQGKLENEVENNLSSLIIRVEECINIETDVRKGKAFVEIIRKAREDHVDLLVMGSHGRSGLEHILTGSVAEKVTRKAPCPVLVVKNRDTRFAMP